MALVLATVAAAGCGQKPEERVRHVIRAAVDAAEQARFDALREAVSERYSDADGHTRESLVDTARSYIEHNRPAHVFTSELGLVRRAPGRIDVEMIVAVASAPIEALRDLARLSADVGVVDLAFVEEPDGAWRLVSASWRPATARDFL